MWKHSRAALSKTHTSEYVGVSFPDEKRDHFAVLGGLDLWHDILKTLAFKEVYNEPLAILYMVQGSI